jgi:anti-sigma factor RsiW
MRNRAKSKSARELVFLVWECQNLGRPLDKHLDSRELDSLVPSAFEAGYELPRLSPDVVRDAQEHVRYCAECGAKVSLYQRLVSRSPDSNGLEAAPSTVACPKDDDVDWHQVATGQWPESTATQLIMHAAFCDHCGPLLRAAVSLSNVPAPQKREWLARLMAWFQTDLIRRLVRQIASPSPLMTGLGAVAALLMIVGLLATVSSTSPTHLSGPRFAEFAASTHRQHAQEGLPLDFVSDSQQTLNEWLKTRLQFALALPASPELPAEKRPYRLEGARLVRVAGTTSAYVSYRTQNSSASLLVTPDSAAAASGGIQVAFKKVTFHYATVNGYKVVTWSAHGLTYALVSDEGNNTQRSCMVCHSAMKDRDLSHTPAPLPTHDNTRRLVLQ